MLHTYYNLPRPQGDLPLFHVHGEARVPNTVILGHYYYGNLLFCCDEYLTHRAPEQRYPLWPGHGSLPALSWLDYLFWEMSIPWDLALIPRRWTCGGCCAGRSGSGPPTGTCGF